MKAAPRPFLVVGRLSSREPSFHVRFARKPSADEQQEIRRCLPTGPYLMRVPRFAGGSPVSVSIVWEVEASRRHPTQIAVSVAFEVRLDSAAWKTMRADIDEAIRRMNERVPIQCVLLGRTGLADASDEGIAQIVQTARSSKGDDRLRKLIDAMRSSDTIARDRAINRAYRLVGTPLADELSAIATSHPTYGKLISASLAQECSSLAKDPDALLRFLAGLRPGLLFDVGVLGRAMREATQVGEAEQRKSTVQKFREMSKEPVVGKFIRAGLEAAGLGDPPITS